MKNIKAKISSMLFLYYFAQGIFVPLFTLYLRTHTDLSAAEIGLVQGMQMISSIVTPILGALIIDRFISAERTFSILQLLSGVFVLMIYFAKSFPAILILNLLYWFAMGPCTPLTNAIAFKYLSEDKNSFGNIRLWGTFGWMMAGILFGLVWLGTYKGSVQTALIFSSLTSFFLFFYSLSLPGDKSFKAPENQTRFKDILKFFLNPTIIVIALLYILVRTVDKFFYTGISVFMADIGFANSNILPAMTVGQITEIAAMFSLSFLLTKFTYRSLLRWGIISEIIRFAMLALSQHYLDAGASEFVYKGLAMIGLAFHGFAFAFFFTTVYIFLDHQVDEKNRTGVHQIYSLITGVISGFIGNFLGGFLLEVFKVDAGTKYVKYWMVPIVISCVALVLTVFVKPIKKRENLFKRIFK